MKNRFKLAMSVCLAFAFAWLCVSQGMLQAASPFIVQMKPPTNMTSYTDRTGTRVTIPATGPVNVTSDLVKDYSEAGFTNYDTYMLKKAGAGDMIFKMSPATLTTAAANYANRTVTVTLVSASGDTHTWFTKLFGASSFTIAQNMSGGTATLVNSYMNFVNGVATVQVNESGGAAATNNNTVTATGQVIMGYTMPTNTSAQTFN